jgi:hypothetical protein
MSNETQTNAPQSFWLWLFPLTFMIHIAEEYWGGGGLPAYMLRTRGVNLSPNRFLLMNGIALALMLLGVVLARPLKFPEWLMACLATVVMLNGLSHTVTTLVRAEYNPGVASGLLIWIPLGVLMLWRLKKTMQGRRYWLAVAVGVAIQGIVSLLAISGGKSPRS